MNLNSIADQFDMSRPAISQHIKLLIECGLIVIEEKGRERYCSVEAKKLSEVADWLEPFHKAWEHRHNKLDDLLGQMKKDQKKKKK
jgi:DNA-binding transcriptional ArsR family regulator